MSERVGSWLSATIPLIMLVVADVGMLGGAVALVAGGLGLWIGVWDQDELRIVRGVPRSTLHARRWLRDLMLVGGLLVGGAVLHASLPDAAFEQWGSSWRLNLAPDFVITASATLLIYQCGRLTRVWASGPRYGLVAAMAGSLVATGIAVAALEMRPLWWPIALVATLATPVGFRVSRRWYLRQELTPIEERTSLRYRPAKRTAPDPPPVEPDSRARKRPPGRVRSGASPIRIVANQELSGAAHALLTLRSLLFLPFLFPLLAFSPLPGLEDSSSLLGLSDQSSLPFLILFATMYTRDPAGWSGEGAWSGRDWGFGLLAVRGLTRGTIHAGRWLGRGLCGSGLVFGWGAIALAFHRPDRPWLLLATSTFLSATLVATSLGMLFSIASSRVVRGVALIVGLMALAAGSEFDRAWQGVDHFFQRPLQSLGGSCILVVLTWLHSRRVYDRLEFG